MVVCDHVDVFFLRVLLRIYVNCQVVNYDNKTETDRNTPGTKRSTRRADISH